MATIYMKDGVRVTHLWVSMFGLTNGKELMLRCIQAGVSVSPQFFEAHQWEPINKCADELEDAYAGFSLKIKGEHVVAKDNGWFWVADDAGVKLQSTIQPESFVTLPPGNEALVNDLVSSGLYRFWCEVTPNEGAKP